MAAQQEEIIVKPAAAKIGANWADETAADPECNSPVLKPTDAEPIKPQDAWVLPSADGQGSPMNGQMMGYGGQEMMVVDPNMFPQMQYVPIVFMMPGQNGAACYSPYGGMGGNNMMYMQGMSGKSANGEHSGAMSNAGSGNGDGGYCSPGTTPRQGQSKFEGVTGKLSESDIGSPSKEWENVTTVMLCNLSAEYTQASLLEEIDTTGFADCYDFFYLPIDPVKKTNRGYAFINFVDPPQAWKFAKMYEGRQMNIFNVGKLATVMPAAVQGYLANHAHYANSRVIHGKKDARPLFFRDGNKPSSAANYGLQRRRRTATGGSLRGDKSPTMTPTSVLQSPKTPKLEGLPMLDKAPMVAAALAGVEMHSCGNCGGQHKANYRFCPFCGSSTAQPAATSGSQA
eukprot:TRINITY_DN13427_c0_g1_i1.p1 TRINITY_DN13427_c0_g1~~TRINITY_DN13427_c0_g1_i1.p1  ORF type:complete len:399 (+),score=108.12 TRINITY_DN13427_c0_g1_i1:177-1373(+)